MKINFLTQYSWPQAVRSKASLTVQVGRGFTTTSFKSNSLRHLSHFHSRF
ncbi:MAG: hypothetical protein ACH346_02770 [Chthoniobacterales bacterium]